MANVTGTVSVPGSNAVTQYVPTATVTESCPVSVGVAVVELMRPPHRVTALPAASVVVLADVRPMPSLTVDKAGPVGVVETLTSPSVAVPAAATLNGSDVTVPPTGSTFVKSDIDVLAAVVVVVGAVVLELLLPHPAATSATTHAMNRAAFISALV